MLSALTSLALVTELVLGGPAAGVPAANIVAAQSAPAQLAVQSNRAQRDVDAARGKVRRLSLAIRGLKTTYRAQLGELEKLSRQRASWNRDRKIAKQKTASQVTAKRLNAASRSLRVARAQLKSARKRLLAALERELSAAVSASTAESAPPPGANRRRARLARLRDRLRRELRPKPRKIVVPDIGIDPSDDPDDLAEKAQILARVETQLRAEEKQLETRYSYYARQDRLRQQRDRAAEIDRTENTTVRRNPSQVATAGAADESSPQNEDPGTDGDGFDDGGAGGAGGGISGRDAGLEASSVVLADVVDDVTATDLRRASRSTNPATRARAAQRARDQVKARLERLRRTRRAIERRAKALKR